MKVKQNSITYINSPTHIAPTATNWKREPRG